MGLDPPVELGWGFWDETEGVFNVVHINPQGHFSVFVRYTLTMLLSFLRMVI